MPGYERIEIPGLRGNMAAFSRVIAVSVRIVLWTCLGLAGCQSREISRQGLSDEVRLAGSLFSGDSGNGGAYGGGQSDLVVHPTVQSKCDMFYDKSFKWEGPQAGDPEIEVVDACSPEEREFIRESDLDYFETYPRFVGLRDDIYMDMDPIFVGPPGNPVALCRSGILNGGFTQLEVVITRTLPDGQYWAAVGFTLFDKEKHFSKVWPFEVSRVDNQARVEFAHPAFRLKVGSGPTADGFKLESSLSAIIDYEVFSGALECRLER
jgi:hypothetical protein